MSSYSLLLKTNLLQKNVQQQESVHLEKKELQSLLDSLKSVQRQLSTNRAPNTFQAETVRKLSEAAGVRVESFAIENNPPWVQIKIQGSANWNSIGTLLQYVHTKTPWVYIDELVFSPKRGKIKLQKFILKWQVSK
jgi:Neuraminidase (sialidase)